MKKKPLLWGLVLLFVSCNSLPRDNSSSEEQMNNKSTGSEHSVVTDSNGIIWKYSFNEQEEAFEMVQMRQVDNDTLTGEALERIINNKWPEVQIKFKGTSNDTAYLAIPESEVLTQQMGSAGALDFMISTTWTYTELKEIKYVAFDFEYGDHAMPGVYSRASWEKDISN